MASSLSLPLPIMAATAATRCCILHSFLQLSYKIKETGGVHYVLYCIQVVQDICWVLHTPQFPSAFLKIGGNWWSTLRPVLYPGGIGYLLGVVYSTAYLSKYSGKLEETGTPCTYCIQVVCTGLLSKPTKASLEYKSCYCLPQPERYRSTKKKEKMA